ncbi:MAG TPA: hypothetical protein VMV69_21645 [Pirellulales bacterium]|nr:hypothetical protein [Pirellulales bacterium]
MNLRRLFALSLAWSWTCVGALAAEPPPSWRLVPDETVLLARVPGGSEFVDALRLQTKFGKTIFSSERLEKLTLLARQVDTEGGMSFIRRFLAQLDLKGDDYLQLFQGDVGAALIVLPQAEHAEKAEQGPLFVGLGWLEPKGDLAERLVTVIQKTIEEQRDDEHPVRRVDLDLAGHTVTHLSIPVLSEDVGDVHPDFDGDEESTTEKIQQRQAKLAEARKNTKKIETGRVNVFFTRIDNRLLLCGTFPRTSAEAFAGEGEAGGKPDLDELSGVEQATGVFARFLEAHSGQGGDTTPPILAAPGLDAALPAGMPLLEIDGDLGRALKLVETVGGSTLPALFQALGIDTLGAAACRTVLDGTTLRSGTFISAQAPRHGLLTLLDQPALPAEPPDWVPVSARAYRHMSFDLGKAYAEIKDLVVAQGGEHAKQTFESIEQQLFLYLQTDVAGLLSSLGQRHTVISFARKPAEPAAAAELDPLTAALSGLSTARTGIVWQVKDEQVWNRLMLLIANVAPGTNGMVTAAEELGFTGYRLKQGPLEAGFFVGRGYLVLGIGAEVTESLLAVLRTPPTGVAALRTSPLIERARALLAPEAGLEFQLSDAGQEMKEAKETLTSLLSEVLPTTYGGVVSPDDAALLEKLKALLPSDEDLEGSVGVSVGQTVVNGYGLVRQSAIELPAP